MSNFKRGLLQWIVAVAIFALILLLLEIFGNGTVAIYGLRKFATLGINSSMPNEQLLEYEIFLATNDERKKRGLETLYLDEKLSAVAEEHSRDMLQRDFLLIPIQTEMIQQQGQNDIISPQNSPL